MKIVDIALIFQMIFFVCGKFYNLDLLKDILRNVILPLLILYERWKQNENNIDAVNNPRNDETLTLRENRENIVDEGNKIRNNPQNSSAQNSGENKKIENKYIKKN